MSATPKLTRDPDYTSMAAGGTVVYRVTVDGRWIGWVGDQRPWRGWRYGGQFWWACWREEGDTAARWNSHDDGDGHKTRAAALADLLAQVGVESS
jgi:hypothetical protein